MKLFLDRGCPQCGAPFGWRGPQQVAMREGKVVRWYQGTESGCRCKACGALMKVELPWLFLLLYVLLFVICGMGIRIGRDHLQSLLPALNSGGLHLLSSLCFGLLFAFGLLFIHNRVVRLRVVGREP